MVVTIVFERLILLIQGEMANSDSPELESLLQF